LIEKGLELDLQQQVLESLADDRRCHCRHGGSLRFRQSRQQLGPVEDDDTVPDLRRYRVGEVVALADGEANAAAAGAVMVCPMYRRPGPSDTTPYRAGPSTGLPSGHGRVSSRPISAV
jgi:hypothetical protein